MKASAAITNVTDLPFRGEPGVALALATIDALRAHEVPTDPANYEIWITHQIGSHPDLSRAIELIRDKGLPFSDAVNADLFERFFANTRLSVAMVEAGDAAAETLVDASIKLQQAGFDAVAYANIVRSSGAQIRSDVSHEQLATILETLEGHTKAIAARADGHASAMLEASRRVEALQAALRAVKLEALTDGLTGIANRRLFDETLRRRIVEAATESTGLILLICDIDHFKRVNDHWGHQVGDQVIRFVASQLKNAAQKDWLAARYGGEEFALIMPRISLSEAAAQAERIRRAINTKTLKKRSTGDDLGRISVSIGLAEYRPGDNVASIFSRADACMYEAKRSGRNQTCIANSR